MKTTKNRVVFLFLCAALFLVLVFAIAIYSYAAETMTLEQAVDTALRNNPGLKAADAQIEIARAGVLRSSSGFLPKVTLSETYSKTNDPLMVFGTKLDQKIVMPQDFDVNVINHPDPISNYNTRFAVAQPVFNGGREYLGARMAKLSRDASVHDRERVRQETVYNVIKAYYGLLLAREAHNVALQSLQTSEANVKLAEARHRAGAVLRSDLLRAKVQHAEVREMTSRSENNIRLATASLNFAMGVPQSTEYMVDDALSAREAGSDIALLIEEASARRPDLVSTELNRRNAETGIGQARAEYLPSLNLAGQVDWNSTNLAEADAKSWVVMAVLQWNLFDGLVTKSRVREAVASAQKMKALEEQTRSSVQLQVRQAFYNLSASLDRIAATASSVQEAEEGLRIVQKRYEAGMTNFVDVLGAETALIRARNNALQALYDNNISYAELKLATGTL